MKHLASADRKLACLDALHRTAVLSEHMAVAKGNETEHEGSAISVVAVVAVAWLAGRILMGDHLTRTQKRRPDLHGISGVCDTSDQQKTREEPDEKTSNDLGIHNGVRIRPVLRIFERPDFRIFGRLAENPE